MSKEKKQIQNVSIPIETHKLLVDHVNKIDGKIYKFVEKAIKEKIEREAKWETS